MAAITDPTTALSPASVEAAGRDRLIQQVELLLRQSGNNEPLDAAAWVDRWLQRPNHALGGAAPELYLNTPAGQALLSNLIGAMAAGSYL
ncbi:MAG: antitoxin Xre/MbcA/ParS toxin-binding domain-containing protein [Synechococcaceae cyanobacterium]